MYEVFLVAEAEEDIFAICRYVAIHDSPAKAATLFDKLHATVNSLAHQPTRGHVPPELAWLDVREFLEIHFKPYRVIYQIDDESVFVHGVLDGRRDLQDILQQRLLRR